MEYLTSASPHVNFDPISPPLVYSHCDSDPLNIPLIIEKERRKRWTENERQTDRKRRREKDEEERVEIGETKDNVCRQRNKDRVSASLQKNILNVYVFHS